MIGPFGGGCRPPLLRRVPFPVGFVGGGRPSISKRLVLYLLTLLMLAALVVGWLVHL